MVTNARVYLDDNRFEYADEAIRCGFIVTEDENGKENHHQDIIDNAVYFSMKDLVRDVASLLQIRREQVLVV